MSINGVWIGEPWVTLTNVTLAGIAITGWDSSLGCYTNPVAYVTVSASVIDAHFTQVNPMYMANVQHITLSGTSIGNVVTGETEISNAAEAPCPHNDHLRFTGNTWHDFLNPNGARDHMECLQFDALARGTSNDNVIPEEQSLRELWSVRRLHFGAHEQLDNPEQLLRQAMLAPDWQWVCCGWGCD